VLDAMAGRLADRLNELATLEVLENGATLRQAGAFQIGFSIAHLRYPRRPGPRVRFRAFRTAAAGPGAGCRHRPP